MQHHRKGRQDEVSREAPVFLGYRTPPGYRDQSSPHPFDATLYSGRQNLSTSQGSRRPSGMLPTPLVRRLYTLDSRDARRLSESECDRESRAARRRRCSRALAVGGEESAAARLASGRPRSGNRRWICCVVRRCTPRTDEPRAQRPALLAADHSDRPGEGGTKRRSAGARCGCRAATLACRERRAGCAASTPRPVSSGHVGRQPGKGRDRLAPSLTARRRAGRGARWNGRESASRSRVRRTAAASR